jgi:hypothetical protein
LRRSTKNQEGLIMQSIQLNTTVNADGVLLVEMPPELKNKNLEVTIVFQSLLTPDREMVIYPHPHFYGACADNPIVIDKLGIDPSIL